MSNFSENQNLRVLLEQASDNAKKEAKKKINQNKKNLELIKRNPNTKYHIVEGMRTFKAVHPTTPPSPYTKQELTDLNLIESIPEIRLGNPIFPTCQYCGENLEPLRARNPQKTKFCSNNCSALYRRLNKKRDEVNASAIFIKHDKKKPPGLKPVWKELDAIYETRFEDEKVFVKEKLPARKPKNYTKGKWKKQNKIISC